MKDVKLPFEINVEMRMYNGKAFPLGIMKANIENYDVWLCNKLINCVWENDGGINSIDEDLWSVEDGLLFSHGIWIEPRALTLKGFDLIKFSKSILNNGYYITGEYNEFYIPNRPPYHDFNFDHNYIIFGYNDEKKVFYSAGYDCKGIYTYYDIDYTDYYNAVTNTVAQKVGLTFRKINDVYELKLEIHNIKNKLKEYCTSKNSRTLLDGKIYGLDAWKKLAEYVLVCEKDIDMRYIRGYMEHHLIMLKRIKYFQSKGYINDEKLMSDYEEVYLKTKTVHCLAIKYNISGKTQILEKISNIIHELVPTEKTLIDKFIDSIVL